MKKIQNYLSKIQWKNLLKIFLSLVIVFLILFSTFSCLLTLPSYAAEDDNIIGTWVFNDTIDLSQFTSSVTYTVEFTDNLGNFYDTITFSSTTIKYANGIFAPVIAYRNPTVDDGGWVEIYYQTIIIEYIDDISSFGLLLSSIATKLGDDTGGDDTGGDDTTCPTLEELLQDYTGTFSDIVGMLNTTNYQEYIDSFPTLPELLHDYTGSFDSIVDMLNSKNYDEYSEFIEYKYNEGFAAGASDDFVNGFFGNMLTGAVRAIDAIVIYRSGDFYISVWTVLTTVVITSFMLGLLKIWRGG